jgi:hypothetical protein
MGGSFGKTVGSRYSDSERKLDFLTQIRRC